MNKICGVTFVAALYLTVSAVSGSPRGGRHNYQGGGGRMSFGIPGMDFVYHSQADCHLPKKVGPCRAMIPSYYFDQKENSCTYFAYGGCAGNANRFNTLEECRTLCERIR